MELNDYQRLAMRTDNMETYQADPQQRFTQRITNALMGLNGEAGEAIDLLKKALFQGHDLKLVPLMEELGDALWYIAEGADAMGITLEDIAKFNIDKLKKRFPEGFSTEDSIDRRDHDDTDGEPDMPEVRDEP